MSLFAVYKISKSRSFQFFGEIISRLDTDKKIVALTFDDGPTGNLDEVLSVLRDRDVKATFYVNGGAYEENCQRRTRGWQSYLFA